MVRLLSFGSLKNILGLLQGEKGLDVNKAEVDYTFQKGTLTLDSGKLVSRNLAINLTEAQFDLQQYSLTAKGVVLPLKGASKLAHSIPLAGNLLTAEDGSGFMGMDYKVKGKLADPDVTVNPLSAITPNFLRKLFGN